MSSALQRVALALPLILATAMTGCTKSARGDFKLIASPESDWSAIFSTRPTESTHAFFIVKLKTQPLFTRLKNVNGVISASANDVKALGEEQDALIKEIQALSSEIKVIYRYRMLINGVAIVAPTALAEKIGQLGLVSHIERTGGFKKPVLPLDEAGATAAVSTLAQRNSVAFIGATEAHALGIRGQGMKVGIIDSGIDYTHAMFGGVGTEDAFKAIDPSGPAVGFPNAKVVGGVDFVGKEYNSGAVNFAKRVPMMDANPIDESGHGTHVAGTVAGIGDGKETYDGVAPDAVLHALKVFGADGSTSDTVVIAALEYAADPNGDADLTDRLDVVNLSLGSSYGSGHILYGEAIRNLTLGGTSVVIASGNEGDLPYITGSPGAATEALSVAASIDNMDHNWQFRAARFTTVDKPEIFVEAIEGAVGKPLAESGTVIGSLVYAGVADQDFTPELKLQLAGKIAFIERGVVTFVEKVRRAQDAGAIGVVVGNNQPGEPIAMGGSDTEKFNIPAIMITKEFADDLKAAQAKGDVTAELTSSHMIEKPERIDTMTSFSSRGPRSLDAFLKPEITAPGEKIVSADIGGGAKGARMSGTSMATPHMAGVMALLHQKFPGRTAEEMKSIAMGSTKSLVDKEGRTVPMSRQGAGRVQVIQALESEVVSVPSSVSLGETAVDTRKTFLKSIEITNITQGSAEFSIELADSTAGFSLVASPAAVKLDAGAKMQVQLRLTIDASEFENQVAEVSGLVLVKNKASGKSARVPVLAVVNRVAKIDAKSLLVRSTSNADSQGAVVDLELKNSSTAAGDAYVFNKIGIDPRKKDTTLDPFRSRVCDLAEAGYRIVMKKGAPVLQVATKLYEPMTTWDLCEVSVLIDSNGDFEADQEIAGVRQSGISGLTAETFGSVLLDVKAARQIRKDYEAAVLAMPAPTPTPSPAPTPAPKPVPAPKLDFTPAITAISPMSAFEHSTIAIVEAPISDLMISGSGVVAVRIATSAQTGSAIEPDDFLVNNPKRWQKLNLRTQGPAFVDMPEKIALAGGEIKIISMTKGAGQEPALLFYPNGKPLWNAITGDSQSQTIKPKYVP